MHLFKFVFSVVGLGFLISPPAKAQAVWPTKSIKLVVPFQAGSATDLAARIVSQKMSQHLKQSVVIENKVGASGYIGADFVAKSSPDGYTVLWSTTSTQIIGPRLNANLSYDTVRDFVPIGLIVNSPYLLVTSSQSDFKTAKEFVEKVKANPLKYTYASAGESSLANLSAKMFSIATNTQLIHVPYKSSAQSVTDVVTGLINVQFATIGPVLSQINSNRLIPLAVTSKTRIPLFPNVPTMAEIGLTGYESQLWMAMLMPKGSLEIAVERITDALKKSLSDPEVIKSLQAQGLTVGDLFNEELTSFLTSEKQKWGKLIQEANIKSD